MGRYDAEQLVRNIERFLSEGAAAPAPDAGPAESAGEKPAPAPLSTEHLRTLRALVVPELYSHAAVDKAPGATRMAWLKQAMLVLLRPLGRRQAAFNFQSVRAVELLAAQIEALAAHGLHDREAEKRLGELDARINTLTTEFESIVEGIEALADQVGEMRDEMQAVLTRLDQQRIVQEEVSQAAAKHAESRKSFETWTPEIKRLQQQVGDFAGRLHDLQAKLVYATEFRAEVLDRLDKAARAGAPIAAPSQAASGVVPAAEKPAEWRDAQTDLAYVQFQRRFRGDETMLRDHQRRYIELIDTHLKRDKDGAPLRLLDLACGDGLFLEQAAARGWHAQGVDLNRVMARMGREKGLAIEEADALESLRRADDASWDVVTAFQFIEHLKPAVLMELLHEVRRVLAPGGIAIFETLNPNTLLAAKWFQLDLTHERLVFPQLLAMLVETAGLVCVEHKGISEVPEYERLVEDAAVDPRMRENLRRLNELLFGAQDYYLIARKPAAAGA